MYAGGNTASSADGRWQVPRPPKTRTARPAPRRHAYAAHVLESGYHVRTVQELLGHRDVSTTMIYMHVLNRGGRGVRGSLAS